MLPVLFQNILVPVDFSINTEVAVKHAIDLAAHGSIIHLLHVVKPKRFWSIIPVKRQLDFPAGDKKGMEAIMKKLMEWKQAIEETIPGSQVKVSVVTGSVQDNILELAQKINPQLIIIGKKSNPGFLKFFNSVNPNELAKLTDCPILTVMKGSVNSKIKIIVVPIRSFVPKRKIELMIVFAKMARAKVHLVALQNDIGDNREKNALLDTYRLLKSVLNNPIEYHLLKGNNFPKAALQYAESIGADMILVNPWAETQVSKLTGKHIDDILEGTSKIKILSVEPYQTLINIRI